MSLFGTMNTAVSGLTAQSTAFGNIGDDVANSQTVGFKRIDTSFADHLSTSTATNNQPGAVVARPDYVNTVQGTITQTDNPLDIAISGQGFFAVSHAVGTTSSGAPEFQPLGEYTREGDFSLDKNGYLVNQSGNFLNGWIANASGALDQTATYPIQISQAGFSPVATANATLSANLPATPDGTAVATQIPVLDALGRTHTLNLAWTQDTTASNTWNVAVTEPGSTTSLGSATIAFGPDGNAAAPAGTIGSITATGGSITGSTFATGTSATLAITGDFGTGSQTVTLDLGHFGQADGLTQFAGTSYSPRALTQDGIAPGSYSGVAVNPNGDLVVKYDNGQSRTVARVPLVTFGNANALQRGDGQAFLATRDSGVAQTIESGKNGSGALVASSVESSNVDIAKEFTNLIVAQRAYSANTKLVTTADELLQSTIDMKR